MPHCQGRNAGKNLGVVALHCIKSGFMQIQLNGNSFSLDNITTIQDLLDNLNLSGRLAVEVNHQIVPRSSFQSHVLNSGDNIEIVHAIGGG